jgi:hypothetical protein
MAKARWTFLTVRRKTMKGKMAVLAIATLIALLVVTPALAAGPRNGQGLRHGTPSGRGGGGGKLDFSFKLLGIITVDGLDADAGTIEVLVDSPDKLEGQLILVETTDSTRFKECEDGVSVRIDFDDLEEGWQVRIAGTVTSDGGYVASRVIQYVP